jgi:hypothetical protein
MTGRVADDSARSQTIDHLLREKPIQNDHVNLRGPEHDGGTSVGGSVSVLSIGDVCVLCDGRIFFVQPRVDRE